MMAGSHGPSGAFTIYRPPWEGFFKPPAMRVVADFFTLGESVLEVGDERFTGSQVREVDLENHLT